MNKTELYWLAGILEGEGSFMVGAPCALRYPVIAVHMTDEDIIERVAKLLGVGYCPVKCKKKEIHKDSWVVRIRGSRAVKLMNELKPIMGIRRQQQIERAVASWAPKSSRRTLGVDDIAAICVDIESGMKQSLIASKHCICRETVSRIKKRVLVNS